MQYLAKLTLASVLSITILASSGGAQAQDKEPSAKPARLFDEEAALQVTLKGPWRTMLKKVSSPEKYPGSLEYIDSSGQDRTMSISISTRGLTRRDRVCDFPPLKLWFDKEQNKNTEFRGQGSLKMVTHCQANKRFEQYYIKEFLAYRIYNLVTPYSFRVRPLMVTYLDSERDRKPVNRFGFLIEDIDEVASRNGMLELEVPEISSHRLDPEVTGNYAMFQYLVGNLDWSVLSGRDPVECCHNSKLIGTGEDGSPVLPIPYDLDSSGVVNTHYAAPPENLPVRNIRQRLFRGFCIHNGEILAALERFRARHEAILDLFRNEPLLTSKNRGSAIKYLEDFYRSLDKPGNVEKLLIGNCRR